MNTALAIDEWRVEFESWAQLFDFAASLYLREPTIEQLKDCGVVGEALKAHLPDEVFPQLLVETRGEDISAIKQEFFDLFFVPVSGVYCSPYEALQGNRDCQNEGEGNINRIFAATGFEPRLLADIPSYLKRLNRVDYIGFELSFIANIFRTASEAIGDDEAQELYKTGLFFYKKHLSAWAADFGSKVSDAAKTNYFMACGAITAFLADVLESDHDEK